MTSSPVSSRRGHPTAPRLGAPEGRLPALLLVVLAVYTEMGFALEWRTAAGRIGPGFFPRIVGCLGLALTLVALVQTLRSPGTEDETVALEDEVGEADLGKHPRLLRSCSWPRPSSLVRRCTLGAIIRGRVPVPHAALLNRGRRLNMRSACAAARPLPAVPDALNAGLPDGILPRF